LTVEESAAAVTQLKMPYLGDGAGEADILKVMVTEGDEIAIEQPVIEIETDKATVEVPSDLSGRVLKLLVAPGQQISSGDAILEIAARPSAAITSTPEPATEPRQTPGPEPRPTGPAGAGYGSTPPVRPLPATAPPPARQGQGPVFASPSVRALAREIGVDIYRVPGSGPSGRISPDDVKAFARSRPAGAPSAPAPLPDFSQFGTTEEVDLSRLRRTIARNLGNSWNQIPHVTLHAHADIDELNRQRQALREAGRRASITAILIQQVVAALKAEPALNASFDAGAGKLVLKRYYNIGVAVDTERGLVVPVIRDADSKSLVDLAAGLSDLAKRARAGKVSPDELSGASFTITNLGTLGVGEFTPIINPPEVAILGVGASESRPAWNGESFEPRLALPLSLSIDHRAVDGADGARFLSALTSGLASPGLI
jgi:pyruvate dehydrogenase E2 component (dihydrolipoamide acetyltransferase)